MNPSSAPDLQPAPAYRLHEICAAGTFGTVCVAEDLNAGRLVALKVLKQAHLHRPRVIARARDEAAMMSRIQHCGIAQVDGLIEIESRPLVVMEWIRGVSLETLVKHFPSGLPVEIAVEIIRQAAATLDHAYHARPTDGGPPMGIIHRDIKPSNMLLSNRGELKVVDFGIAHGKFEGKEAKTLSMVLGARGYLAPERLDGHDDKPTCDTYSLGICLYELLTGKHIILSVHHQFHAEALEKNLKRLEPPGLSPQSLETLRAIVGEMCHYFEEKRSYHAETVARLGRFLEEAGLQPDLPAWSREHVVPIFAGRAQAAPVSSPSYADLAFLDRTGRGVTPVPPDVDAHIAAFLRQADWPSRIEELELLLLENPHWTLQPFLDVLPEQLKPWWQFWGRDMPEPDKIIATLALMRRRPSAEARRRVMVLRKHPDPAVVQAATDFLELT